MAACGLPVVANAIGDMESVFGQYKLGVLVNDFSIESFNIATDRLIQMLGEKIEIPSEYKLEEAVEKYERVYKDVLGE
jgi:glycosyltransferase involved in cell wall biosynthesis